MLWHTHSADSMPSQAIIAAAECGVGIGMCNGAHAVGLGGAGLAECAGPIVAVTIEAGGCLIEAESRGWQEDGIAVGACDQVANHAVLRLLGPSALID